MGAIKGGFKEISSEKGVALFQRIPSVEYFSLNLYVGLDETFEIPSTPIATHVLLA
jgi:hypothetical protein